MIRDKEGQAKTRQLGSGQVLEVGDFVMFRDMRPGTPGISDRFKARWRTEIFQIQELISGGSREVPVRSCILCDPSSGANDLGFSQPVSVDQLRAVEVLPISCPDSEGRTRVKIDDWTGTIVNQCLDGRVYIRKDGDKHDFLYDLSKTNYQWLVGDSSAAHDAMR